MSRFLYLSLLVFAAEWAQACSCGRASEADGFVAADTVLIAETLSAALEPDPEYGSALRIGIRVIDTLKGNPNIREVRMPADSAACGGPISVPSRYWFYLDRFGRTNGCTATRPLLQAELPELREYLFDALRADMRRQRRQLQAIEAACALAIQLAEASQQAGPQRRLISVPIPGELGKTAACTR